MRKNYLFILLILFCTNSAQANIAEQIQIIINDVKSQYALDVRTSLFDVIMEMNGDSIVTLTGEVLAAEAKTEVLQRLSEFSNLRINDQIIVLPDATIGDKQYAVIRISVAQLRKGADVDKELVSQAIMGAEIRLLKRKGYFYFCQMEDNYLGWMMGGSFIAGDINFINSWRNREKLIVIANFGQVWEKPDERSYPVSDVVRGNKLIKVGHRKKWFTVELPDGRSGYIKADLVTEEKVFNKRTNITAKKIIHTAMSVRGHPYLWGGTSPKGFDCSGFTQSVFKFHGIQLPRDANMQVKSGTEVPLKNGLDHLLPGDLLFFGSRRDRIIHVGIYIGNYRFIHSDDFVRINSFDPDDQLYSEYRLKGLQAARRIL